MLDRKIVLKRISELMEEKGISSYELQKNTGVSTTINQWRKNPKREKNRIPSLRSIEKICEFFNISLSYFFAFDVNERKNVKIEELLGKLELLNSRQFDIIETTVDEFNKLNTKK